MNGITSGNVFNFWCQKVLPLVYDDSLSYYEVLCKMCDYVNGLMSDVTELQEMLSPFDVTITEIKADIEELQSELEKVKNGDYTSMYIDSLSKWIDNNLQQLVSKVVKFVVFGLSNDGNFVAYVPSTWEFMQFDTIIDPTSDLYGHLIMKW